MMNTGVDTNMFDNVKTAVYEYEYTLNELKSKLQLEFIEKLKDDCIELKAEFPELEHIFVLGYTPEWNDGEECEHSSEIYIMNNNDRSWDTVQDYLEYVYNSEYPIEFKDSNIGLSTDDAIKIKDILHSAKFEDGLEVVYETNFNMVIDLTSFDIKITVEEYDCGH